jgi:peroxidase
LNSIFLGLVQDLAWKFGSFGFELQNTLFQIANNVNSSQIAVDLLATNINRGRDHGLQPYINYVKSCLNITINNFTDLGGIMNGLNIAALQAVYEYLNVFFLIIEIYSFFVQIYFQISSRY